MEHRGTQHPKITTFPWGTLPQTGMLLAAFVNKAKTIISPANPGLWTGDYRVMFNSSDEPCALFPNQQRHGQFSVNFELLNLPGSSGRDSSTYHCYSKFCKAFASFRRIWHNTAQETGSATSPLCTASASHPMVGLAPGFSCPKEPIPGSDGRTLELNHVGRGPRWCLGAGQEMWVRGAAGGLQKAASGVGELKNCAGHKLSMGVGGLITQQLPWGTVSQELSFTGRKKRRKQLLKREKRWCNVRELLWACNKSLEQVCSWMCLKYLQSKHVLLKKDVFYM